jgi:hypothetical protein
VTEGLYAMGLTAMPYRDTLGPEVSFEPDKHQGANSSFLAVVKGGRWVRLTDPLSF